MELIQTELQEPDLSPLQNQDQKVREKIPILVYYNWPHTYVHNQETNIDEAMTLLHKQPSELEYSDNHIGFTTAVSSQAIQFIKLNQKKWLFDVPIYGDFGDKYDWTEEVFNAIDEFDKVIQVVALYFDQGDLFNSLQSYQYDRFLEITTDLGIEWQGKIAKNIYGK